ncbi:MAG: hypothetical protein EBR84_03525 [Actinobacteria bacterium]|nr:hypothetical protein [Actinomycetota bacterium]
MAFTPSEPFILSNAAQIAKGRGWIAAAIDLARRSLACVAIGFGLLWADRKFVFGHGRLFALYLATYCAARGVIETLRVDEAIHIAGIRLNVFTALIVGVGALIYLVRSAERYPGQEIIEEGRVVGFRTFEEVHELRKQAVLADAEAKQQAAEELAKQQAVAESMAVKSQATDSETPADTTDEISAVDSDVAQRVTPTQPATNPSTPRRGRRIAPKEK